MKRTPGILRTLLLTCALAVGLVTVPPAQPAQAFDVYTTPGTHLINGREWRTACEYYSSTVERCRTEIKAHTITYDNGRFAERFTWVFNNLTYKASPRAQWAGNILAVPGEHLSGGRRWKTECDTAWTGQGGCRSMIWTNSYVRTASGGFGTKAQWVFNNIVRFTDSGVATEFCVSPKSAVQGLRFTATETVEPTEPPQPTAPVTDPVQPLEPAEPVEPLEPTESPTIIEPAAAATPAAEPTEQPAPPSPSSVEPRANTAPEAVAPQAAVIRVSSAQHPDLPGGALFDRLGPIEVKGTASSVADGTTVKLTLVDATGKTRSSATASVSKGSYSTLIDGGFSGQATLTAAVVGAGQASWNIELRAAGVSLASTARIEPLGSTTISGKVTPGVAGVAVEAHVAAHGGWVKAGAGRTTSDGSYTLTYQYGAGSLGSSQVRVCATLPWGPTIPSASSITIERARIANPVITNTTAAEVSLTYRSGCPVGPGNLSTVRINQQSMDGRVYRGEIIVRRDRAAQVADVFTKTFEAGFPVYQMTNPDAFGADDIKMMAANNTSAFNCRHVVGNPYSLSPHSYGYAVDVNPVQNPYRDPSGKWHPSTQYVKRTPVVPGMLTTSSAPVKAFQAHGWSWFSGWDWHHFEKR